MSLGIVRIEILLTVLKSSYSTVSAIANGALETHIQFSLSDIKKVSLSLNYVSFCKQVLYIEMDKFFCHMIVSVKLRTTT